MPSNRPPALVTRLLPLSMLLAVGGCAAMRPTPTILAALDCASLIPPSYRSPIPPTRLPPADATAGGLWSALDDQTARLDRANGRTADVVAMADACQAHQSKAAADLKPRPWWKVW